MIFLGYEVNASATGFVKTLRNQMSKSAVFNINHTDHCMLGLNNHRKKTQDQVC